MNSEQFTQWQDSVREYSNMVRTIAQDRTVLKKLMIEHLKQFFDFDDISFEDGFTKITLKWDYCSEPVIDPEKLDGLNMGFVISHGYSDELGNGIIIELYPFGLPKGVEEG